MILIKLIFLQEKICLIGKVYMKGKGGKQDKRHSPLSSGERLTVYKLMPMYCVFFYYS